MKAFVAKYRRALAVTLVIAIGYAVMFALGWTCPIKGILGVSCPGCGMTRACINAVCLDFRAAFAYHPLWILLLPYAVTHILLAWRKKRIALRVCMWVGIGLLLAAYIWRMATSVGDVVVFEPQNGLIGRGIRAIFGGTSE